MENWIDLDGLKKGYSINVATFEIKRTNNGFRPNERLSAEGYVMITLNGINYSKHRIIAEIFLPNPLNLPEVDHIDRNRQNNNPNNLRWVNRNENARNRNRPEIPEREYIKVNEEELEPIWVNGILLPANTYYYSQEHDAIVKRGRSGRWFALRVHQRGGIDRINLRDINNHNRMVTLSHVKY